MKYIDENIRIEIKNLIEQSEKIKNNPQKIKSNKSLISIIKPSKYYKILIDLLNVNDNFETLGYLIRCALENKNLLSCDTCGKELTYSQSFKSVGNFGYHCSRKCAQNDPILKEHIQNQLTSYYMEHYGVTNPMQLSSTVLKSKKTFIEHYGVDNNMKSELGQQAYKKAMQEKYGVDYTWQLSSVQESRKNKCLDLYGVEFPLQSVDIRNKTVETKYKINDGKYCSQKTIEKRLSSFIEHYGVDNNMKSELGQQAYKKAMQEKYGVDYTWQLSSVQEKSKQTNLNKYGFENAIKNNEIRKKAFDNRTKSYYYANIHFDSAPELAMYIFLTDNNIKFEYQPDCNFLYEYDNQIHKYFPDFKINDVFYEIKGDHLIDKNTGKWICPWNHDNDGLYEAKHQFILQHNIVVLTSVKYQQYLDYIDKKYGKEYLKRFKKQNIENEV